MCRADHINPLLECSSGFYDNQNRSQPAPQPAWPSKTLCPLTSPLRRPLTPCMDPAAAFLALDLLGHFPPWGLRPVRASVIRQASGKCPSSGRPP